MNNGEYSKRKFLKNLISGISAGAKGVEISDKEEGGISKIGNLSLAQLREKYYSELFEHFIPNMEKFVIDHEIGGFMCDIDIESGTKLTTTKRAWFEGRGIWVYSFIYNNFGEDPYFLQVARKSKDFILKHQPIDNNFWIASFARDGSPLSGGGDIFGNLYIAEGLAEYSIASDERVYYELAKKILLSSLSRYDSKNYISSSEKKIIAPRLLNHWMILLRNSTQMLEHESDPEIEQLAQRCVDAIMNHHLNSEYNLLNVTLSHDLNLIPNSEYSQEASFGLGIQSLWMVMFEALRLRDVLLFKRVQKLFKRHVDIAQDPVYGGYFWSLDNVDKFSFSLGKAISVHDEVLIGAMFLIEHRADEWAQKCFAATGKYVEEKFNHPEYLFSIKSGDRKLATYSTRGVGIYHHPRQLILNLLAIERMIQRKGRVSTLLD